MSLTTSRPCARCGIAPRTQHHHYCRLCKKTSNHISYLKHRERRLEKCREYISTNYEVVKTKKRIYAKNHSAEIVARATIWNKENMDTHKVHQRNSAWKVAGILNSDGSTFTCVDYDRCYQVQQGRCNGCGIHQSELKGRLHTDHDHKTGIFRFLLCMNCNRTLGHVQDSPTILRKLADLLEGK